LRATSPSTRSRRRRRGRAASGLQRRRQLNRQEFPEFTVPEPTEAVDALVVLLDAFTLEQDVEPAIAPSRPLGGELAEALDQGSRCLLRVA